jgi:hypothetical protein
MKYQCCFDKDTSKTEPIFSASSLSNSFANDANVPSEWENYVPVDDMVTEPGNIVQVEEVSPKRFEFRAFWQFDP